MVGNRSAAEQRLTHTIVPLKLDFAAEKKGGMAVSAVWRLVYFLAPCPSEPKEQTAAHRRCLWVGEMRCAPPSKIQKQGAIGCRVFFLVLLSREAFEVWPLGFGLFPQ